MKREFVFVWLSASILMTVGMLHGCKKNNNDNDQVAVIQIATGTDHTMILMSDNTLWVTGSNTHGQLGDGTTLNKSTPVQVMTNVVSVAAGFGHTLILKSDKTLWATGSNANGQLGDGTLIDKLTPVQIMTDVSSVVAGYAHTLILKSDKTLWAAGFNH